MYDLTLTKVRRCLVRDDRDGANQVVREAILCSHIMPRDGIELLLALREGNNECVVEALELMRGYPPGTYRYVPKAEHAFA